MKKSLSLVLALVFVLGIAGTAFAANPFTDVPAKHWSYDAVSKLVKAGIVDGYDDGSFRGDKTMTRYEMAQVVAKAISKEDKADAANKALIEKLSAEYSAELNNLGVRVSNLESKMSNVNIKGEIRAQYDYDNNSDAKNSFYRLRLNIAAPISEGWTANGRIEAQNTLGDNGATKFGFVRGYVQGPLFNTDVKAGRYQVWLGQGFTGVDKDNVDGAQATIGNQLKVTAGTVKNAASVNANWYRYANMAYNFSKAFNTSAFYLKDNKDLYYKTWGVGFAYTGWDNLKLTAEYGKNAATSANDAKAYAARLAWKGADISKAQTWGTWVGYRNADANYDQGNLSTLDNANLAKMNDIKGWEIGFTYAPIKNVQFKTVYLNTSAKTDGSDKHQYLGQVEFFF